MKVFVDNKIDFDNEHEFMAYCLAQMGYSVRRCLSEKIRGVRSLQSYIPSFKNTKKPKTNYSSIEDFIIRSRNLSSFEKYIYFFIKKYFWKYDEVEIGWFSNKIGDVSYRRIKNALTNLDQFGYIKYANSNGILSVEITPKGDNMFNSKNKDYKKNATEAFSKVVSDIDTSFVSLENAQYIIETFGEHLYSQGAPISIISDSDEWNSFELVDLILPQFQGVPKTDKAKEYKKRVDETRSIMNQRLEFWLMIGYMAKKNSEQPADKVEKAPRQKTQPKNNYNNKANEVEYFQFDDGCLTEAGERYYDETCVDGWKPPTKRKLDKLPSDREFFKEIFDIIESKDER